MMLLVDTIPAAVFLEEHGYRGEILHHMQEEEASGFVRITQNLQGVFSPATWTLEATTRGAWKKVMQQPEALPRRGLSGGKTDL